MPIRGVIPFADQWLGMRMEYQWMKHGVKGDYSNFTTLKVLEIGQFLLINNGMLGYECAGVECVLDCTVEELVAAHPGTYLVERAGEKLNGLVQLAGTPERYNYPMPLPEPESWYGLDLNKPWTCLKCKHVALGCEWNEDEIWCETCGGHQVMFCPNCHLSLDPHLLDLDEMKAFNPEAVIKKE
jgi:hypothetical protein